LGTREEGAGEGGAEGSTEKFQSGGGGERGKECVRRWGDPWKQRDSLKTALEMVDRPAKKEEIQGADCRDSVSERKRGEFAREGRRTRGGVLESQRENSKGKEARHSKDCGQIISPGSGVNDRTWKGEGGAALVWEPRDLSYLNTAEGGRDPESGKVKGEQETQRGGDIKREGTPPIPLSGGEGEKEDSAPGRKSPSGGGGGAFRSKRGTHYERNGHDEGKESKKSVPETMQGYLCHWTVTHKSGRKVLPLK